MHTITPLGVAEGCLGINTPLNVYVPLHCTFVHQLVMNKTNLKFYACKVPLNYYITQSQVENGLQAYAIHP